MAYTPTQVPSDPSELPSYLAREFQNIAQQWTQQDPALFVQTLNVAPTKPREGMVVNADGTNWNPGQGAGLYVYLGGSWQGLSVASDNVLTPTNKGVFIKDYAVITSEQSGLDTQATDFAITTEKTNYDNAIAALTTYLGTLTSPVAWNNTTGNTAIVGTTWRSTWEAVYTNRHTLINAIYAKSRNAAITISLDGTLSGAGGGQVTLPGMGQHSYRVTAAGGSATSYPTVGVYLDGGAVQYGGYRSYNMARISRATGLVDFQAIYDVYGVGTSGTTTNTAATLAADLNATGSDHIVMVWTRDEPQTNRLTSGLDTAMYRCGASRAIFGSSQFQYRSAYILIGSPGCGEGNGAEFYQGSISSDPNAWCDASFTVLYGGITGVSSTYKPRTLTDYGYTGDLNATNGAPAGTPVAGTFPGSTPASTVETNAANGNTAHATLTAAQPLVPGANPSRILFAASPTTCVSGIQFDAAGTISRKDSATLTTYTAYQSWYINGTPGTYYIKFAVRSQSGGTLSVTTGAWSAIAGNRAVLTATSTQVADAIVDYWIASDSAGANIVSNGTITLHAEST